MHVLKPHTLYHVVVQLRGWTFNWYLGQKDRPLSNMRALITGTKWSPFDPLLCLKKQWEPTILTQTCPCWHLCLSYQDHKRGCWWVTQPQAFNYGINKTKTKRNPSSKKDPEKNTKDNCNKQTPSDPEYPCDKTWEGRLQARTHGVKLFTHWLPVQINRENKCKMHTSCPRTHSVSKESRRSCCGLQRCQWCPSQGKGTSCPVWSLSSFLWHTTEREI